MVLAVFKSVSEAQYSVIFPGFANAFRGIPEKRKRPGLSQVPAPPGAKNGQSRRYPSPPLPLEGALGSLAEVSVFRKQKRLIIYRLPSALPERKTRLEPTLRVGRSRRYSSPPLPLEGVWGSLAEVSVFLQTKKTAQRLSFPSGKRDSNPRYAWVTRAVILHPRSPSRGPWGRSPKSLFSFKQKRQPERLSFPSGKRDSNSRPQPWQGCALPTELFPQNKLLTRITSRYPLCAPRKILRCF